MEASTENTAQSNGTSESPWAAHTAAATNANAHPELPVIGALVGGFIFAKILKALGGGDDE